jgi:antitoxin component of MazEF toxin-antitoxin module
MLKRRIQTSGKGSFIVTLPMHVILALGLKKGMDLEIVLEKNHIVLTPAPEVTRQDVDGTGAPTTA